jgi:hypothetical protein
VGIESQGGTFWEDLNQEGMGVIIERFRYTKIAQEDGSSSNPSRMDFSQRWGYALQSLAVAVRGSTIRA